jgi:hypothetical protein
MHVRRTLAVVLSTTLLAYGCSDSEKPETPLGPERPSVSLSVSKSLGSEAAVQQLAHKLALALNDADVRAHVRNAMRASPVTEHKLVLQEFITTPSGRRLVEAAARSSGVEIDVIEQLIAELPEMDFYAPYREHRLTWKGTADVVVAGMMDVHAGILPGYTTEGELVTYEVTDRAPARAVLVIHPSERKGRRINPQPAVAGSVIQDADDGEVSGRIVWMSSYGDSTVVDFADMRTGPSDLVGISCETCLDDGGGSGGGGSSSPSDTTILNQFKIYFDDGVGSAEIEFYSKICWETGDCSGEYKIRYEGVDKEKWYSVYDPMLWHRVKEGSADYINTRLIETDAFSDDDKGSAQFDYTDNGTLVSVILYWLSCDPTFGCVEESELTADIVPSWTPKP